MGQRSQIYFRVNQRNGKYVLLARYFQWNYGTRMISRARGILEWLEGNKENSVLFYDGSDKLVKLGKIMEINFDYKDVVNSIDIVKEYEEGYYDDSKDIFLGQDNNDGQLIIDMFIDYEHENKVGDPIVKFKYAFLDWKSNLVGNGEQYMQWNENYGEDGPAWRDSPYIQKEIKYTERNIRYIDKHAELMTEEEVNEYINHDYISDMDKKRKEN